MKEIGAFIKFLREEENLSQKELAETVGISQPAIAKIENGLVKDISLKTAIGIADALNVSFRSLFKVEIYSHFNLKGKKENIREWSFEGFIEELDDIKHKILILLGHYAQTLTIPPHDILDNKNDSRFTSLFGPAIELKVDNRHLCYMELMWNMLKNQTNISDEDLDHFIENKSWLEFTKLESWYKNYRIDLKNTTKYLDEKEIEEIQFYGVLNIIGPRYNKDRKIKYDRLKQYDENRTFPLNWDI